MLDGLDLAACGFFIGQAIGRWGNFFNQEAFGSPTNSMWGMSSEGTGYVLVHPCFLYESIWCILGFVLLHFLGNHRKFKGQLALTYGVWYGVGRAFIEQLRTDSLYWGPLKVSQWLSGALVIVCGALLIYMFTKIKTAKKDETYVAMFDEIDSDAVSTARFYEGDEEETNSETDDETNEEEETSEEIDEVLEKSEDEKDTDKKTEDEN